MTRLSDRGDSTPASILPRLAPIFPRADHHVHSTFSDGSGTILENARAAVARDLRVLGCVDHVRRDTRWLPDFVKEVHRVQDLVPLRLTVGVEAKILSTDGTLDLPPLPPGVDEILAADHQVPTPKGPASPREIAEALAQGRVEAHEVLRWITTATVAAMRRHPRLTIAHLFSILPKLRLATGQVPDAALQHLAREARDHGVRVEISERWRCPDLRAAQAFRNAGVTLIPSTDAHDPSAIGRYDFVSVTLGAILEASPWAA